ncbi:hypothetical protein GCM10008024_15920 [Allgaiera indica]|uniref:Uncharacterized protein n=1 Tax=Allgaiera indica TaxID=765699 RepID=A0AAN4UQH0_9RHOB|nr:hypothetical protein GCM10008024_15920 [Allgaiera indica]
MSLRSLDTVLLEMPLNPTACTRPSPRQVETPPIQASWNEPCHAIGPRYNGECHECLFRGLAGLEEAQEIAALPELRRPQVQRAQTGIESLLSILDGPDGR